MPDPFLAGVAVLLFTLLAVMGPPLGLSAGLVSLLAALALGGLSLDAFRFGGRGGQQAHQASG